jgi:hypothetical protein
MYTLLVTGPKRNPTIMRKPLAALMLVILPLLPGCGITQPMKKSESHLYKLQLGSTTSEVRKSIGTADRVRASTTMDDGRTLELDEYAIYPNYRAVMNALLCPLTLTLSCWFPGGRSVSDPYWLQFVDGKLLKWGRAGDFQIPESKQTVDLNVTHK